MHTYAHTPVYVCKRNLIHEKFCVFVCVSAHALVCVRLCMCLCSRMSVRIYLFVFACACVNFCMCVCLSACVYMCLCVCVQCAYACVCASTFAYACVRLCMCACVRVHLCMCACVCVQAKEGYNGSSIQDILEEFGFTMIANAVAKSKVVFHAPQMPRNKEGELPLIDLMLGERNTEGKLPLRRQNAPPKHTHACTDPPSREVCPICGMQIRRTFLAEQQKG